MTWRWLSALGGVLGLGSPRPVPRFESGEVWTLRAPGLEDARLVVLRVDPVVADFGAIVHVAVEGLALQGPGGAVVSRISHMPLSADAVAASVATLVERNAAIPDFAAEYAAWTSPEEGAYGVLTVPVERLIRGIGPGAGPERSVDSGSHRE